jgi:hypothetical protein
VSGDVTALPLTTSQARQVVRHLFGASANINPSGPTYYIVTLDGHVLAEGFNVFVAIRNAIQSYCQRTDANAQELIETALHRLREAQTKEITL